jgi:alcohol dehydrogenase class IV
MAQQTIIIGDGSCKELKAILVAHRVKRFLLVCGPSFHSLSIENGFRSLGIPYSTFSSFGPNPKYEDICNGVDFFHAEGCDAIVAVGGGSGMDVAKCIKLFSTMEKGPCYLDQEFKQNDLPFLAIPTTAGTGSESTRYAIIYREGKKHSVVHESLVPSCIMLEPNVLESLPLYQKKCTMLDALSQAIESWWSVKATDDSKAYAKEAVVLFQGHYQDFLAGRKTANLSMLLAANWAGKAINITQTTAPHAMSYKLSALFGIPHGHAVAICMPAVWRYLLAHQEDCTDARGTGYLRQTLSDIAANLGFSTSEQAIDWFSTLLETLGIKAPDQADETMLKELVASVNVDRLKNLSVTIEKDTIERMYRDILGL